MSTLTPISYASSIIGFISFAISLATLIRVIWGNLSTLSDAPEQVHYSFANLKQALYEERAAVHRASRLAARRREHRAIDYGPPYEHKRSSRHASGYGSEDGYSGASIKIMQDTIRKLCRDFKRLERPFLREEVDRKDTARNDTWGSDKRGYEEELERYRYREEGFIGDYSNMTLGKRLTWLKCKSDVNRLWVGLERLQLRRMAREVTEALGYVRSKVPIVLRLRYTSYWGKWWPANECRDLHYMQMNMRDLKLIQDPASRRSNSGRRIHSTRQHSDNEDGEDRIHVRRTRDDR